MIRTIRPIDLVALAAFEGRSLPNAACTRHGLGREQQRPLPVRAILEQWLPFEGHRSTWVAVRGFSIDGLISARHRAGRTAWEVDWLIVGGLADAEDVALRLLDQLSQERGEAGAHRVFLRLPSDSFLVGVARQAGFWPYTTETLYRWDPQEHPQEAPDASPLVGCLRRKTKADDYGLFRLYNLAVPEAVRRAHGVTFTEWREAQEPSPGRRQELVAVRDGKVQASVVLSHGGSTGMLDLMVDPQETAAIEPLLQDALHRLGSKSPAMCLVPEYQAVLQRVLEQDPDAHAVAQYTTLVKYLTVRVPAQGLVPAHA